jgi:hypothetical protein
MTQQSEHLESAKVLLGELPAQLAALQAEYRQCVQSASVSPSFRAHTLSYLVNLRAVLDYLAHELVPFLSKTPPKLYFPIAKRGMPQVKFEQELRTKWLPGLDVNRPDIFSYLMGLQHFHPGNEWITAFHELSNQNKHVRLSKMAIGDCEATVVRMHGRAVMQIGDRGLHELNLSDKGSLSFEGSGGRGFNIRGPQVINRNTTALLDADPGLDVARATWTEFKFDQFPLQPAVVFLEIAEKEVRRIATKLESLL